jgi:hypothetical protein
MIKVSSRFLAVLMLAVLAFTDVTTTSAFAQRGVAVRSIRPYRPPEMLWREPRGGGGLENSEWHKSPGETCNIGCEAKGLVDWPPQEENSRSGGVLRPYRSPDSILR